MECNSISINLSPLLNLGVRVTSYGFALTVFPQYVALFRISTPYIIFTKSQYRIMLFLFACTVFLVHIFLSFYRSCSSLIIRVSGYINNTIYKNYVQYILTIYPSNRMVSQSFMIPVKVR